MGMHSYEVPCPNCGKEANAYESTRDMDFGMQCLHCGYYTKTVSGFETFTVLNALRKDYDLAPLKTKPKQNKKLICR